MSALLSLPQSLLQLRLERTVGRWRAAGRREQVGIETDTGLFNDDVGSVDTNVSKRDWVDLCFV
jgi:hypothetical protein